MRITFVHCPEEHYDQSYGTQFIPLWAHTLASHVPEKWDVEITGKGYEWKSGKPGEKSNYIPDSQKNGKSKKKK